MSTTPSTIPTFSKDEAVKLAKKEYGLVATAKPLPSYEDQNFRLKTNSGQRFILKISNSSTKRENLDLEHKIMQRLAHHQSFIYPQVQPTLANQEITTVEGQNNATHLMRLLTYLPGRCLGDIAYYSPELLYNLGVSLASMDRALLDFSHPAMHKPNFVWDLKNVLHIRSYLSLIKQKNQRAMIEKVLTDFESMVQPCLPELRCSVIHCDANTYNVLVDPTSLPPTQISGIIDFGDCVYSYTIFELAIAMAYILNNLNDAVAIIKGYHNVLALTDLELSLILPLICVRLAISVARSTYAQSLDPDNEYISINQQSGWALLEKLQSIPPQLAHYTFRHACGLSPCPQTPHIVNWLNAHPEKIRPVVTPNLKTSPKVFFDLSIGSPTLASLPPNADTETFSTLLFNQLKAANAPVGIGLYNEARRIYSSELFQSNDSKANELSESRTIHLGLDLFMPADTPIFAPLDGIVHSFQNNTAHLDYGPTIILQHQTNSAEPISFYTLYGHLSEDSLQNLQPKMIIKKGTLLGKIGNYPVNGDWPPHLHFQIITDLLGRVGEFPGVALASQCEVWLSICPDPNLILGIPTEQFPPVPLSNSQLLNQRQKTLSPSLSISYKKPLNIVKGLKQYLYDDTGRAYLDMVNNVCHVGHCHPHVVKAAQQQMAVLNTNTRYLHPTLTTYAKRLLATFPAPLTVCFFVCSGSEANELALRLARTHTKRKGIIVIDGAYHGNTNNLVEISPYKFDGPGGFGLLPYVYKLTMPDTYRGRYKATDPQAGEKYAAEVEEILQCNGKQIAAFMGESLLGCGGQIVLPPHYLQNIYHHVKKAGVVCIADEVQVGFGRVGSHFWGFELQDVVPDIVTLGKPMGNGHPLAAVITTPEIAASFNNGMEYFNTFGGNPVSCAIGLAVLDVIEQEGLQQNAYHVGQYLKKRLQALKTSHSLIGDVRGEGLFIGIELVLDHKTLVPAAAQASYIINRMKDHGILLSTDGPLHNVIKIKPPIVFTQANADLMVDTLDEVLKET